MEIDVNEKGYTFALTLVLGSWNAGNFMFYLQIKVFNNLNNKEKNTSPKHDVFQIMFLGMVNTFWEVMSTDPLYYFSVGGCYFLF